MGWYGRVDRGKKKAIVATGCSLLVVIWHLLSGPDATFIDLGAAVTRYEHDGSTTRTPKQEYSLVS